MNKHILANEGLTYSQGTVPPFSSLPSVSIPGTVMFDGNHFCVYSSTGVWEHINIVPGIAFDSDAEEAIDTLIKWKEQPSVLDFAAKYPMVHEALQELETVVKLCQGLDNEPEHR